MRRPGDQGLQDRAGDAALHRLRQLLPVGVAEQRPVGAAVDVLDGTAAGDFFRQLDALVFLQHLEVVGDPGEVPAVLARELDRADAPVAEHGEDFYA